jgi:polyhydroxyalkanoate synthase
LVEKGHTVFMVSWKNPNEADRELGMDDYLDLGIRDAISAVRAIVADTRIHAVGYCIGGTLLSIAAADLARRGDQPFASMTLLAAQTDFSSPGELSLFISPSQLDMLEAVMNKAGVLTSEQMGASFMMLRSRDLLWNPVVNTYVKGQRQKLNDLMAWNSDGTRMPCRMHSEYLRQLYLNNDLAAGRYKVHGEVVELSGITLPMFVLGTEADHVAPWKSVYKARGLTRSSDFTFVLTSAGHNGGIVCGPEIPSDDSANSSGATRTRSSRPMLGWSRQRCSRDPGGPRGRLGWLLTQDRKRLSRRRPATIHLSATRPAATYCSASPLVHVLSAVDRNVRAGDERRLLARQVGDETCDFLGLAQAAHRNLRNDLRLEHVLRNRHDHFGADVAR